MRQNANGNYHRVPLSPSPSNPRNEWNDQAAFGISATKEQFESTFLFDKMTVLKFLELFSLAIRSFQNKTENENPKRTNNI